VKKKKKVSSEKPASGEIFPVDTLGIPILVDVVKPTATPDSEASFNIATDDCEPDPEPPSLKLDADREETTEAPAAAHLDQIIDKITKSVTGEIMAELAPLIQDKVSFALKMYNNELLQLPDEENEKKPESR